MENLRRFLADPVPDGFIGFLSVVGFIALMILALILMVVVAVVIRAIIKQRRARKLAAEIKVNPKEAYQQILNQEKLIAEFDVKEAEKQAERRKAMVEKLVNSQGEFTKNFPFIDMETIRAHAEKRDHVNR